MQAITGCQSSLSTLTLKIDTVQLEVGLIRQDFDKIHQRVTETERRISDTEDAVRDHSASLHTLQVRVRSPESRAEDAKNRNRRNNLRIVGLPEGSEGPDPAAYTELLLRHFSPRRPSRPSSWWRGPTGCHRSMDRLAPLHIPSDCSITTT